MNKYIRILRNGIILSIILAIVSTAIWTAIAESEVKVGYLDTSYTWTGNGGYVASGDGTWNDLTGTITVSGIPADSSVEKAYIYWASTNLTSLIPDDQITIDSISITGTLIGIDSFDPDHYWHMYRSEVTSLITGNGDYAIGDLNNVHGASIVVVYSNDNSPSTRVIIADGADNGGDNGATGYMTPVTFSGFTVPAIFQAYLTYIIADGEIDYHEQYYFNDNLIATDEANASDTVYWDTDTYNITGHLTEGDTNAIANVFEGPGPGDDLGWEVCIFSLSHDYNFNGFFPPAHAFSNEIKDIDKSIFKYTNDQRKKYGLNELIWDEDLAEIAREHSLDMATNNFFDHINLKGEDPTDRAIRHQYPIKKRLDSRTYSIGIAENIASMPTGNVKGIGYVNSDAESIGNALVNSWMASPGHRENILNSEYDVIGVGVAYDGQYYLATQNFK